MHMHALVLKRTIRLKQVSNYVCKNEMQKFVHSPPVFAKCVIFTIACSYFDLGSKRNPGHWELWRTMIKVS